MLTVTRIEESDVVEVAVEGELEQESMRALRETVVGVAEERGRVRLLVQLGAVGGVDAGALREDLKAIRQVGSADRMALLTDSGAIRALAKIEGFALRIRIRVFPPDQRAAALAWLRD